MFCSIKKEDFCFSTAITNSSIKLLFKNIISYEYINNIKLTRIYHFHFLKFNKLYFSTLIFIAFAADINNSNNIYSFLQILKLNMLSLVYIEKYNKKLIILAFFVLFNQNIKYKAYYQLAY